MSQNTSPARRRNPWVVMTIVHAAALVITLALFVIAMITAETDIGPHAREAVAAWVMAGVVFAPLITAGTAIWWISGRQKEAIPAAPEPGPYDSVPIATSSMHRIQA